jgi:hypothetical protein
MSKYGKGTIENAILQTKYGKLEEEIAKAEKDIKNIEKDIGLPHIPMGKNTHSKTKDGYVYNKTKINVQPNIKDDPVHMLLQERVKSMWNSLSDDVRDSVDNLVIKKSRAKGRRILGGTWKNKTKTISMNISERSIDETGHNFFHEVGHAKWNKIKDENPETVKKFIKAIDKIGYAPTAYSLSYQDIEQRNLQSEQRYRRNQARGGHEITEESKRTLVKNREIVKDLYHNEIHSELNAHVMGVLKPEQIIATKEYMTKYIKAYKEMWDL